MKKAFTLVELLIVVMIIGILATLAVPQYQKMVERARAAEAIQTIGSIMRSVSRYYMEYGNYPRSGEFGDLYSTTDSPWGGFVSLFSTAGLDISPDETNPDRKWEYIIQTWSGCWHGSDTDYTVVAHPHEIAANTSDPDEKARIWHGHMEEGQIVGKIINRYTVPGDADMPHDWDDHQ